MCKSNARHTVTLNQIAFELLKQEGRFGESYSQLILRILNELQKLKME